MPSLAGNSKPSISRDDSLEYYIKFPTASTTTHTASGFGPQQQQQHQQGIEGGRQPPMPGSSTNITNKSETNDYQLHHQMASSATYEETEDSMFVYNETNNVPVVLLLGWAGCQDKYLMKYSKIYEDRG